MAGIVLGDPMSRLAISSSILYLIAAISWQSASAMALDGKTACESIQSHPYGSEVLKNIISKSPAEFIQAGSNQVISVSEVLANALGLKSSSILIRSAGELRFLPYTQEKSDIILISDSDHPLNKRRAAAVVATALRSKIKVHTLWMGPKISGSKNWLREISSGSFGQFIDFSNIGPQCTPSSR